MSPLFIRLICCPLCSYSLDSPSLDVATEPIHKSLPATSIASAKSVTELPTFVRVERKRSRFLNSLKTMLPTCCMVRPFTCKSLLVDCRIARRVSLSLTHRNVLTRKQGIDSPT
jgi:hypothetical protein